MRERRQHAPGVEMHEIEELGRAIVDPAAVVQSVRARRVEELLPDGDDRIEGVERRLEDHRALGPAVLAQVIVVELADVVRDPVLRVEDLALGHLRSARRQPDESHGERRLPGAALADDRERLALLELERDIADGVHGSPTRQVVDGETADRQDRHLQEPRSRGLKMSSSADAKDASESCTSEIARIGLRMYQRLSR